MEWRYRCTASGTGLRLTRTLLEEGYLCRTAFNSAGQAIANVRRLLPGHLLHVAYTEGSLVRTLGSYRVEAPTDDPNFSGLAVGALGKVRLGSELERKFTSAGYERDPHLGCYTAWRVQPLDPTLYPPPSFVRDDFPGNNALHQHRPRPNSRHELADGSSHTPVTKPRRVLRESTRLVARTSVSPEEQWLQARGLFPSPFFIEDEPSEKPPALRPARANSPIPFPPLVNAPSLRLPRGRTPDFDAYVMVDWSANAAPKTGADSIWWSALEWEGGALRIATTQNPRTRSDAERAIHAYLQRAVREGKSVLVGFDFPYGYPAGLGRGLGLRGDLWRAVWERIAALIADEQDLGTNNRFSVAGQLNQSLGGQGPFWGVPAGRTVPGLPPKKPPPHPHLAEFRITERATRGPKSAWQLNGAGSVGGQVLMGLPTLLRLTSDPELAALSQVWPFETGPVLPPRRPGEARIIHAEIYPSLVPVQPEPGQVKDEAQVLALARWFAQKDAADELRPYFEAPSRRSPEEQAKILQEEGWILGV